MDCVLCDIPNISRTSSRIRICMLIGKSTDTNELVATDAQCPCSAFCWNQRNWYAIYKLDRIEMVKIMNTCVSGANMSKSDCQLRWECQMAITKMIITENVRFTNQFCRTWWHFLAASRQDNINEILLSNRGGSKWHLEMFLLVIFLMDVPRKFCFDYYSLLGGKSGKNVRNG